MNTWFTFILFSLSFCITAHSQAAKYEFKPVFKSEHSQYISEVIEFRHSFDDVSFIGISAYHFDEEYKDIKYRVQNEGQWTPWHAFSPQHELGDRERTAYEGEFILQPFSELQIKSTNLVDTPLSIRLYVGKKQKALNALNKRSLSCDLPDVCDRSCWCSDCPVDTTPEFTDPTHIIIHHSAGSNQADLNFAEVVNYIWDLHVNTNGWDDIGYNWLIDPNGVLYEGRPDNYQGAHFSCINENTIGICLLGNFSSVLPKEEAVSTLVNLIGYEASEHNIDVIGESYHETGEFNLTNVAGHRDSSGSSNSCSSTACPGDAFYPTLGSIRDKVVELACYESPISSTQSFDDPSWSVFPNPFTSTLTIRPNGNTHSTIEIRSISGQSFGTFQTGQSYELSHLTSGIYFLMVDGHIIKKLVKQ